MCAARRAAGVILEYGDYECPYSRQAFRQIERVERRLEGAIRFAFRHFPLTEIHPHAFAASAAAEAAARQNRFWEMHELLFHRQKALEEDDLRRYAAELGLDAERFDRDRGDPGVAARIQRDIDSGIASGDVLRHPHPVHRRRRVPGWVRHGDADRRPRQLRPGRITRGRRAIRSTILQIVDMQEVEP